jgi:MarR family transcriptional regulator, lower aerobic nicotinate degradation pathway regulator
VSIQTEPAPPLTRVPGELAASSTFLLKRLGFVAKDQAIRAYEQFGLTPYHHAVLAVLAERPPETQGAIAEALGYDKSHLVGLLDELEQKGLVERSRDPADRRRHTVRLTADGDRMLTKLRRLAKQLDDQFLARLSSEERAELHGLLRRLAGLQ